MNIGGDDVGGEDRARDRLFDMFDKRAPVPGTVLVASPDMPAPNFHRSIVYMIEHDANGSLGVVLTRCSDLTVEEVLPVWAPLCASPARFHIGGPVKPDTGIALAVLVPGVDGSRYSCLQQISGRVHVLDLDGDPDLLTDVLEGIRVFVGYTGWAPGQLQGEMERGDWYVATGCAGDLTAPAHVDIWADVLRRQEMPLPLYATFVADGRVN